MSALKAEQEPDPSLGLEFPTVVLTRPVAELDARIFERTGAMLKAGWIEETEAAMALYSAECPGLMSIGYREIVLFLQGEMSREDLVPAIVRSTRQYAKRQRTWFRHVPAEVQGAPDDLRVGACLEKYLANL